MAMRRAKSIAISLLAGVLIPILGALLSTASDWALWPGLLLAAPFWPEGIHSDFSSSFSFVTMFLVIWGGSWICWSALTYVAIRLGYKAAGSQWAQNGGKPSD